MAINDIKIPIEPEIEKIEGSIANDYDNTATYAVNDIVRYNGDLYKCTTAITTAEDWTSSKWTSYNPLVDKYLLKADKITLFSEEVTDGLIPSAKLVYDTIIANEEAMAIGFNALNKRINNINSSTSNVSISNLLTSGTTIGILTIDDTNYTIKAPSSLGGSTVSYSNTYDSGYSIGTLTIDGTDYTITAANTGLYAGAQNTLVNSATTNGNTYLTTGAGSSQSSVKIVGSGGTSVTSESGTITISSTITGGAGSTVSTDNLRTSGYYIGDIIIDGVTNSLYAAKASVTQSITSGTAIATIDGTTIYAPTSSSNVSISNLNTTGSRIATITIGSDSHDIYAPTSGDPSTTVVQTISSGKELAQVNSTSIYHPENTAYSDGLYKITVDDYGHVTSATAITVVDLASYNTRYLRATTSSGYVNATTTNGNTYLSLVYAASSLASGRVNIVGSGLTSVTSNNSGKITISTSLSAATSSSLGGIKIGYTTSSTDQNYAVLLDSNNQAYVNVPWSSGTSGSYLPLAGGTMSNSNLVTNMNADLLDSKEGKKYLSLSTTDISTSSALDSLTGFVSSKYGASTGFSDIGDWGNVISIVNNGYEESTPGSNTNAFYALLAFDTSSRSYFRTRAQTSDWSNWRQILNSENYSSYALPLTGGTLTGNLCVGDGSSSSIYLGLKASNGLIRLVSDTSYNLIESGNSAWSANKDLVISGYSGNLMSNLYLKANNIYGGDFYVNTAYQSSDIRLKNIIKNVEYSSETLSNLPLFTFTWKDSDNSSIHLGTSAQAVEEIIPELISSLRDGYKSLDYATLGVISGVIACKEIEKLKIKIKELEDRLDKYENGNIL